MVIGYIQPEKEQKMITAHMHIHVENYDHWRSIFDSRDDIRQQHGVQAASVLRSVDNPGELVVLLSWSDLAAAQAFITSPDLRAAMQQARMTAPPQILYLEDVT
jgi:quinol monooxygenase YgiN